MKFLNKLLNRNRIDTEDSLLRDYMRTNNIKLVGKRLTLNNEADLQKIKKVFGINLLSYFNIHSIFSGDLKMFVKNGKIKSGISGTNEFFREYDEKGNLYYVSERKGSFMVWFRRNESDKINEIEIYHNDLSDIIHINSENSKNIGIMVDDNMLIERYLMIFLRKELGSNFVTWSLN